MNAESENFEAVVYDLDGTLVDLDVDWNAVAMDVVGVYADAGLDAVGKDLWELLGESDRYGLRGRVEEAISEHERDGARTSHRLPLADEVEAQSVPVAVCSLNCEAACRVALETHGLDDEVGAVIGRDSVSTYKPDPEPLLAAISRLGADPDDAVFVGDTRRDEITADRAGVAFRYVE